MHTAEIDTGALVDGRYRVVSTLGTGGMSRVYLARDEALGRDVALKVFPAGLVDDADGARRSEEVRLLAGLTHPALVVLFDAALDADPAYLSMEHVLGETLHDRLARGPLEPDEAAPVVAAVARALEFVHAQDVVHRDVKPANILLPAEPALLPAKLADFGIARLLDSERLTMTGTVIGTAAYIAPEQASGSVVGPPSDIYALGIVLIEAVTGELPFPGGALEAVAARLARDPDLSAARLAPFRELLERMTDRDPARRPDAGAVAAALEGRAPTRMLPAGDATAPMTAPTVPVGRPGAADRAPVPAAPRDPARRAITVVAALFAALVLVLTLPLLRGPAAPEYPAVDGALGADLVALQDAVAGTGLEHPVLAATEAAAAGDLPRAGLLIEALAALAEDAVDRLEPTRVTAIEAAIAAVRADLAALEPEEKILPSPEPEPGPGGGQEPEPDKPKPGKPDKPGKPGKGP